MSLRVGYKKGTSEIPAIIVAPHGYEYDDTNTDKIAEEISSILDCTHIINYGWERSDKFDYFKDKANCNNIEHVMEDVIKQEFLDPIINSYNMYLTSGYLPALFIIHGVHDSIKNSNPNNPDLKKLDLIIGAGSKKRPSCKAFDKILFSSLLTKENFNVFLGAEGGNYAGASKNNLNQILNHPNYLNDHAIDEKCSFQIEIIKTLRQDKLIDLTSSAMAEAIKQFLDIKNNPQLLVAGLPNVQWPTI